MLKLSLTLIFGVFLLCEGCARKEPAVHAPQAASPAASLPVTNPPTRLDASTAQAPAQPTPQPLAEGKRVRITKLEVAPLEITVPPDFNLRMQGGVESNPEANLEGPDWRVVVREPEGGFFTLKQEREMLLRSDPGAKIIHAQNTADGFVLVDQDNFNGPSKYSAQVSSPALKVECGAWGLDSLSDAERAASICLTLGPAPGRGKSHVR